MPEWKLEQYKGYKDDIDDLGRMLLKSEAVLFGNFTLTSGRKSSYYVDVKRASTNIPFLNKYATIVNKVIPRRDIDLIGGVELGAIPLVVSAAMKMNISYLMIRKSRHKVGTAREIEGSYQEGQRVGITEDVFTSGGSAISAAESIEAAGLKVAGILTVVDRLEGAKEALDERGYKHNALLPITKIKELQRPDLIS